MGDAAASIQAVIEAAKTHLENGKYCDPDFPAAPESLYGSFQASPLRQTAKKIVWLRPEEFTDAPKLFLGKLEPNDVVQGELGDCYFLGSLAIVATRADLLKEVVIDYLQDIGLFICRLYKNGEWITVPVDDRLPCRIKDKHPIFAHCKDKNEMWVPLMEKAYAKVHGSYQGIVGGSCLYAFTDLTSGVGETLKWNPKDKRPEDLDKVWKAATNAMEEGWLLGGSSSLSNTTEGEVGATGILAKHTYSVIRAAEATKATGKKVKLLQLRNPWGGMEWKGKWSDGSPEWTPEILAQLNYTIVDDGTFWMRLKDFCKFYTKLFICHLYNDSVGDRYTTIMLKGEWKGETAGGCPNNASWCKNPQFGVTHDEPQPITVVVGLSQEDTRVGTGKNDGETIGLNVYEAKVTGRPIAPVTRGARVYQSESFTDDRDETAILQLKPNVPYVVIPSTFDAGHECKFFLRFFSKKPIKVTPLGPAKEEDMVAPPEPKPEEKKPEEKKPLAIGPTVDLSLCFHCLKPVLPSQRLVKAAQRTWHVECFVCGTCKKPFANNKFFTSNGDIVCVPCKQAKQAQVAAAADKCGICKNPIVSGGCITLEEGVKIHSDCFVCTICKNKITGTYCRKDGKLYCSDDYQKTFAVFALHANRMFLELSL